MIILTFSVLWMLCHVVFKVAGSFIYMKISVSAYCCWFRAAGLRGRVKAVGKVIVVRQVERSTLCKRAGPYFMEHAYYTSGMKYVPWEQHCEAKQPPNHGHIPSHPSAPHPEPRHLPAPHQQPTAEPAPLSPLIPHLRSCLYCYSLPLSLSTALSLLCSLWSWLPFILLTASGSTLE